MGPFLSPYDGTPAEPRRERLTAGRGPRAATTEALSR